MSIITELFHFIIKRKKFFLLPIIFASLLIGSLLVFGSGSAVTPFIYALF